MQERNATYQKVYQETYLKDPSTDADAAWVLEQDPKKRRTMTNKDGSRCMYHTFHGFVAFCSALCLSVARCEALRRSAAFFAFVWRKACSHITFFLCRTYVQQIVFVHIYVRM